MKYRNNKLVIAILSVVLSFSLTSCVDDLNVTPIDPSVTQTFNQDGVFAKIYASLALTGQQGASGSGDLDGIDEGTSSFIRLVWNLNELTTDEAICSWGDPGIPEMNFNTWTSSHDQLKGLYARFYFGISLCNLFLEETEGQTDDKSVKQRAEARYMRALNYYYLLDMFGNVPFATKVTTELPKQIKRAELYTWILNELTEIEADMYAPRTGSYYRADQAANWMLQTRMYLNAEVYTGTAQWNKAAEYSMKVMTSAYKLNPSYEQLFMGDNAGTFDNSSVNTAPQEIILPIAADGIKTSSYGNSIFLIASTRTTGMPAWGTTEGWGGNRARYSLGKKFFPGGIPTGSDLSKLKTLAGDDRAMFFGWDIADSKSTDVMKVVSPAIFKQGLSVTKYTNVRADKAASNHVQFVDTDYALMRIAEAYLSYAEAVTRGASVLNGKAALDVVNDLRTRAHASKLNALSLETLCDEWSREFFFEGRRRTDLIRFGFYGGSDYNWEWKGGSMAGTKFSANYNLFPIPTTDLTANPNLVQNTGY